FLGTDATGTMAAGNGLAGVYAETDSNAIGQAAPATHNVISTNGFARVNGISEVRIGGTANLVQGNILGLDRTGKFALPDPGDGVLIENAPSNVVGTDGDRSEEHTS